MKRLLSVTLVSIIMLETVGAIQSFMPANRLREHSDKCFCWQLDKIYSPGDILELPGCGRAMCYLDGTSLKERVESCPRLLPQPPCYLAPPNLKYSYPMCCPKTVCPGDKGYVGNVCPGDFQTTNEKWASSGSGP